MNCKKIGNYVLVCDKTDWYFDNDENGMSYFIYKPTDTKYSMVMAPNSCCINNECEPQIDFGVNAQVVQTTVDEKEAQEWLNNLVNSNFMGMIAIPTYIKQYESVRKYVNTVINPTKFTESDTYFIESNMYKAYRITENNFKDYLYYSMYHFDETVPKEYENAERLLEGILSTVGKALAGKKGTGGLASTGIIAFLPTILSKIPFLAPYVNVIMGATCVAKIIAGIAQAKSSDEYIRTTSKKDHAKLISAAVLSQMLQCFGAWKGQRFIKMLCTKVANLIGSISAKGQETATVAAAATAAAATTTLASDAGIVDTEVLSDLHNDHITIDEKVDILKDKGVSEEKIPEIVKSIEKETAITSELKTEAATLTQNADQQLAANPPEEAAIYNPAAAAQSQADSNLSGANNVYNKEQPVAQSVEQQTITTAQVQPQTEQQSIQPATQPTVASTAQNIVQSAPVSNYTSAGEEFNINNKQFLNHLFGGTNYATGLLQADGQNTNFTHIDLNNNAKFALESVGLDPNSLMVGDDNKFVLHSKGDENTLFTYDPETNEIGRVMINNPANKFIQGPNLSGTKVINDNLNTKDILHDTDVGTLDKYTVLQNLASGKYNSKKRG